MTWFVGHFNRDMSAFYIHCSCCACEHGFIFWRKVISFVQNHEPPCIRTFVFFYSFFPGYFWNVSTCTHTHIELYNRYNYNKSMRPYKTNNYLGTLHFIVLLLLLTINPGHTVWSHFTNTCINFWNLLKKSNKLNKKNGIVVFFNTTYSVHILLQTQMEIQYLYSCLSNLFWCYLYI